MMKSNTEVKHNLLKSLAATLLIVMALLPGCKTGDRSNGEKLPTGKTWELISINGSDVNMNNYPTGVPTVTFNGGGGISGTTGCNSYNGSYKLNGDSLSLDLGATTKMACDGSGELDFIFAIDEVNMMKIIDNGLTLFNGSKEVLSFKSK